ncbi:solute carrier family 25 member 32-like [Convolutriloba macropyga]|uniref:solute carrier family 25 member 32-like n=1 Tax=Convolutriloba macropyga TaxID=536237 RepID=UPI003F51EBF2
MKLCDKVPFQIVDLMQVPKYALGDFLLNFKAVDLVSGVTGGVVSTLCCHPLDIVKIRLAVNDGFKNRPYYESIRHICKSIYSGGGVFGFYQGVTPNIIGASASWGLYFYFYNASKKIYGKNKNGTSVKSLSPGMHMLSAAQSGAVTLALTNPIWVTKTRLCLQYESNHAASESLLKPRSQVLYRGFVDCLVKTYKLEGIRGLYSGFSAGLLGVSHGAFQFMAYEEMKKWYSRKFDVDTNSVKLATKWYLLFSASSKLFAVVLTYPYQVVRARLQDQHRIQRGFRHVVKVGYQIQLFSREESLFLFFI